MFILQTGRLQINMEFNLNDFKFMQGFVAARQFLVQLRNAKLAEVPMNRKNTSTNSLSFSPIARRQSQICEHSSEQSLPSKHKRSPSVQQQRPEAQKPANPPSPQAQATPRQNSPILSPTQQLKSKINSIILQLNISYNQLQISQTALQILSERLEAKKKDYTLIEKLKNEERDKHVKILTLKNAILKKREKLEQKKVVRERFREVVRDSVKDYLRDMEEEMDIKVITVFAKDFTIRETQQVQKIEEPPVQYPDQLSLKFKKIKKREKKKQEQPQTSTVIPPPMPEPMATFFSKQKKSKSFGTYDAEIQSYCDDIL